jgi:hypothetical protein
LHVCADPNNLPFSNAAEEGFENRIMQVLARDMGVTLSYIWHAQRRGFVRETLKAGLCDIIPGTAAGMDMLRTTAPYYRSTYVFAARADRGLRSDSLHDPLLHVLGIGVQLVGEDGANPPPAEALARRGLVANLRGYMVHAAQPAGAHPGRRRLRRGGHRRGLGTAVRLVRPPRAVAADIDAAAAGETGHPTCLRHRDGRAQGRPDTGGGTGRRVGPQPPSDRGGAGRIRHPPRRRRAMIRICLLSLLLLLPACDR